MAFLWLINGGDPNHLLTGMILQGGTSSNAESLFRPNKKPHCPVVHGRPAACENAIVFEFKRMLKKGYLWFKKN